MSSDPAAAELERLKKQLEEANAKIAKAETNGAGGTKNSKKPKTPKASKAEGDGEKKAKQATSKVKEVSDTDKQKALRSNPPGARIANSNMENSLAVLAGYLTFEDTSGLRAWMEAENSPTRSALEMWRQERLSGFRVPGIKATQTWQLTKLFQFIEQADREVYDAELPLDPDRSWKTLEPKQITFGYAGWMAAMAKILKANPERFPDSTKEASHKTGLYATEDWMRVYWVLRAYWRQQSQSRDAEASTTRNTNQLAVKPTFLTDDDIERFKTGATLVTAVNKDNPEPALAEAYLELGEQIQAWEEEDNVDWELAADARHAERVAAVEDEHLSPEDRAAKAEQRLQEAEAVDASWSEFMLKVGTNDTTNVGRKVARPPLTVNQLQTFLARQGSKAKVLHDEFSLVQEAVGKTLLQQASVQETVDPEMTQETSRLFWELQEKLSTVTAPVKPYEEACLALGLDPVWPKLDPTDESDKALVLKPWQVTGILWMLDNEDSFIRGGIVADDCGLGKTILTLAMVYFKAKRMLAQQEEGELVEFKPTLIVCPSPVIDVWFKEWEKLFKNFLHLRQFHGIKQSQNINRQQYIVGSAHRHLAQLIVNEFPPSDPESAKLVVLTSYGTWHSRTLKSMPKQELDAIQAKAKAKLERGPSLQDGAPRDKEKGWATVAGELTDHSQPGPPWLSNPPRKGTYTDIATDEAEPIEIDPSAFRGVQEEELLTSDRDKSGEVDVSRVYSNHLRGFFGRVVADEGHIMKVGALHDCSQQGRPC